MLVKNVFEIEKPGKGADSEWVRGLGSGVSVEPSFDTKFHFHRKGWINLGYHIYPK